MTTSPFALLACMEQGPVQQGVALLQAIDGVQRQRLASTVRRGNAQIYAPIGPPAGQTNGGMAAVRTAGQTARIALRSRRDINYPLYFFARFPNQFRRCKITPTRFPSTV